MDAASISMMKMDNLRMNWSMGLAGKIKDLAEQQSANLVEMIENSTAAMERSVHPHLGANIDIRL